MKPLNTITLSTALFPTLFLSFDAVSSPMFVYAQSPIHSNVLSTQLRSAEPNRAGTFEFKSSYTQASIWAHNSDYALDYYQNQTHLVWHYSDLGAFVVDVIVVNGADYFVE